MFSTSKCGIRTLRVTLRSVHPLLACPPPHFSSPYSTPLPPRLSPDSTRTATRRTCRRPHPISPPTARPRRFGRCDLHLAHSLQPLVAGPQGQSVPICAPRVPVSLPTRTPFSRLLPLRQHLPPCALRIDPPSPQAERAGPCRQPGRLPPPLSPSPVALLLVGWPGCCPPPPVPPPVI